MIVNTSFNPPGKGLANENQDAESSVRGDSKMTNKLQVKREMQQVQVEREILAALEFELVGSVAHAGGILTGFSMKIGEADCLMTLRAEYGSKRMVAFVGCPDMSSCFRKAVNGAYTDTLKWREDLWVPK